MEIISALSGAVVGSIVSIVISHFFSNRAESKQIINSLNIELRLNIEIAEEILENNLKIDFSTTRRNWGWCKIIPFTNSAWKRFLDHEHTLKISEECLKHLSGSYSHIENANFQAVKIQMGRFNPRDGAEYTKQVEITKNSLGRALEKLLPKIK